MRMRAIALACLLAAGMAAAQTPPTAGLRVPQGFAIDVVARVPGARAIAQ